jgi:methanogenesis imperfect marker protein 11
MVIPLIILNTFYLGASPSTASCGTSINIHFKICWGVKKKWFSPFNRLVASYDEKADVVELVEDHARGTCQGGAAWSAYHIPRTSPIVTGARREGPRTFYQIRPGRAEVRLDPTTSPIGIEECRVEGDGIHLTYVGLGGAGVGITGGRAKAGEIKEVKIEQEGGGGRTGRATITLPLHHRITVGMDDTDSAEEGATWSLGNEMGYSIDKKGLACYLMHTIVQLFPAAPGTTRNCAATALGFAVMPERKEGLIETLVDELGTATLSDETGLALLEGVVVPEGLRTLAARAKKGIITLEEVEDAARSAGVHLVEITGKQGLIGACAALGLSREPGEAVRV